MWRAGVDQIFSFYDIFGKAMSAESAPRVGINIITTIPHQGKTAEPVGKLRRSVCRQAFRQEWALQWRAIIPIVMN